MTGGQQIEPSGLPESSLHGAFWPAQSKFPFANVDMRWTETVSWPPLDLVLPEGLQDQRPYTNGSTSNAFEGSQDKNEDSSGIP